MNTPKETLKPLHRGLAAHAYGSFIAWLCSSSNLWSKNKAPYEAQEIYAKRVQKSTGRSPGIAPLPSLSPRGRGALTLDPSACERPSQHDTPLALYKSLI